MLMLQFLTLSVTLSQTTFNFETFYLYYTARDFSNKDQKLK